MKFLDWMVAQPGMTEVVLVQGDDGSGYYLLEANNTIFGKVELTVTEKPEGAPRAEEVIKEGREEANEFDRPHAPGDPW